MLTGSRDSSVSAVINLQGWTTGKSWLVFRKVDMFLFSKTCRRGAGTTRGIPPGHEAHSSTKSSNELKNSRSCISIPPFAPMVWTGTNSTGGISVEL
jgi:hypothetical protein